MSNKRNGTLYIGITGNLIKRIYEHKAGVVEGFTKKYGIKTLVYCEHYEKPIDAITREKQLKGWIRKRKIELIESSNKNWDDLYGSLF